MKKYKKFGWFSKEELKLSNEIMVFKRPNGNTTVEVTRVTISENDKIVSSPFVDSVFLGEVTDFIRSYEAKS